MSTGLRSLRLGFAGTPEFAVPALDALASSASDLRRVHPAGPAGRPRPPLHASAGQAPRRSSSGCPCISRRASRSPEALEISARLNLDALVVVAYGLILPAAALRAAQARAASTFMPRCCRAGAARRPFSARCSRATRRPASPSCAWRQGLDTGPMLAVARRSTSARTTPRRRCMIGSHSSARELIVETLTRLVEAGARPRSAAALGGRHLCRENRQGRGADRLAAGCAQDLAPGPRLQSVADGARPASTARSCASGKQNCADRRRLRRMARRTARRARCSPPTPAGIDVACGRGVLRILRLQLAGRKPLAAREFIQGQRLDGARFAPRMRAAGGQRALSGRPCGGADIARGRDPRCGA